jgi:hypothetical protein
MRHLILFLPIALAACATTGPSGLLALDTASRGQILPGANCAISNNAGNWNVTTPASVAIGPANGDLRIVCNKEGYRTAETIYQPSGGYGPYGSSVGVGVGGGGRHVGGGVGLSFPIGGGSARSGSYPERITVDMNLQ